MLYFDFTQYNPEPLGPEDLGIEGLVEGLIPALSIPHFKDDMNVTITYNMARGKRKGKYDKARDKAYRYYFQKWRGNEKETPAFGQKIRVTRSGWDHLINPSRKRTKVEQARRFEILPLARKLLEEAQTFQEHRKDNLGHYFAFVGYLEGRKIKVVVRSKTFQGQKYFYSVMIVL